MIDANAERDGKERMEAGKERREADKETEERKEDEAALGYRKGAINNLHHLSLCAPLDHSANSSRNLRQNTHASRHAGALAGGRMLAAAGGWWWGGGDSEVGRSLWPSPPHVPSRSPDSSFCLRGGHVKLMPPVSPPASARR